MLRALKGEVSALEPLLQLAAATDRPAVSRLTAWLYAQLLPGSQPSLRPTFVVRWNSWVLEVCER